MGAREGWKTEHGVKRREEGGKEGGKGDEMMGRGERKG